MKRTVNMPDDDPSIKNFPIPPVGEHKFRIIDVMDTDDVDIVSAKCEVISESGKETSLLHRITLNEKDKFFWLTRLFLKCISEPCRGAIVVIDTDAWIGRTFTGVVKHSVDSKYANIKEFIYKDEPQSTTVTASTNEEKPIVWDE